MTNRIGDFSLVWASAGEVTDPDLDTEHPIFQEGKYLKGWKVEKEPHQWQNYLYQITDLKKQIVASEQFVEWDEETTYVPNAVVRYEEALYLNDCGEESIGTVPGGEDVWRVLLGGDAESITAATSDLVQTLAEHLAEDNPHDDNIHDIGGYESSEIDAFLGDPDDSKTIIYHEAQVGAVHGETPEQVGTLPDSGGTFTGDVEFIGGITLDDAVLGKDGPEVMLGNSLGAIHLTAEDKATANADKSEITTEANFDEMQMRVNNLFALPTPIGQFDFSAGNFSQMSVGRYTLNYNEDEQSFDEFKGWVVADGVSISGLNKQIPATHICEYFINDDKRIVVLDSANLFSQDLKSLATYFNGNMTHLLRLTSYPRLTNYQKATIYKG